MNLTTPIITSFQEGTEPDSVSPVGPKARGFSIFTLLLFSFFLLFLNACASTPNNTTTPPPTSTLRDLNNTPHNPLSPPLSQFSVVIFTMTDCPIANAYTPEINRLVEAYTARGVTFYLVHTDPETTRDDAIAHAADFKIQATVLTGYRPAIALAKKLKATITPQAILINHTGATLYSGRINNFYEDFGVKRAFPNKHELRDAINTTLAGGFITTQHTEVVGCTIPTDF